jgi:uncharacterized protein (DUF433 family)
LLAAQGKCLYEEPSLIRVTDVLDLLAAGLSAAEVVDELPDLELEDVTACLRFASRRLAHPIVAA